MRLEKNKIVTVLILVGVVLFIVAYTLLTFGKKQPPPVEEQWLPLPKMKDPPPHFTTKTAAVQQLKEEKQIPFPDLYDPHQLHPLQEDLLLEKMDRDFSDSLYIEKELPYQRRHRPSLVGLEKSLSEKERAAALAERQQKHQLFFTAFPQPLDATIKQTQEILHVRVDGTQTIKQNYRLRMRLNTPAIVNDTILPENTVLYGFVSFRPQRALLRITSIGTQNVRYAAYDLADGNEGIYIENSISQEVTQQVTQETMDQVNLPGLPSVRGLKQLFRRKNREVKVTIVDHYQLILKPES